ncbi:hypothetical protein [Mesomycoplasma ovipneumoniae]|uniref:hypothetical protein n=1 Tax=Mesomycoplasma ovipneumoniae TaxID=29562 RepID=UPI003080E88D
MIPIQESLVYFASLEKQGQSEFEQGFRRSLSVERVVEMQFEIVVPQVVESNLVDFDLICC